MRTPKQEAHLSGRINRRGFLASSMAIALLPLSETTNARADARGPDTLPQRNPKGLMGFGRFPDSVSDVHGAVQKLLGGRANDGAELSTVDLAAAEAGLAGESLFLQTGVSIGIHSFSPALTSRRVCGGYRAALTLPLCVEDANGAPREWCAWSHSCRHQCDNTSASVVATLPVGPDGLFRMNLTLEAGDKVPMRLEFPLYAGISMGSPKLRRGVYILPLPEDHRSARPNWRTYALGVNDLGPGVTTRCPFTDRLLPPRFNYVVISVDYGAPIGQEAEEVCA